MRKTSLSQTVPHSENYLGDEEDNLGDGENKFITNSTTLGRRLLSVVLFVINLSSSPRLSSECGILFVINLSSSTPRLSSSSPRLSSSSPRVSSASPRLSSECGTVCDKLVDEEDNLGDEEDKFITNSTTLGRQFRR
jgi:hypothetical protein